jgi:ATP/ADP translocase
MVVRFLSQLLSIKPSEWDGVLYFFLVLLIFSFGASFARSIGMTLLVEKMGGDKLPIMFILVDMLVMLGSLLYAHYTKKSTGLAILGFFLLATALFSVLAQFLFFLTHYWGNQLRWVYGFFFVGFSVFQIFIAIHIGSVIASYFTAVQIKRVTTVINAGIPIGGVLGGSTLITLLRVFQFQPQQLVVILGWACLAAFALLHIINARLSPVRSGMSQWRGHKNPLLELIAAFNYIVGSSLMIFMSLGLILFVIGNKLLEYQYQTVIYYEVFPDATKRATFFAIYEIFANLTWLFIQLLFTSRLIMRLGVGASNVLYPILSAIASLALFSYFYLKAQNDISPSVIMMLTLGIFSQFINQEMRGALRTPANNLLFNAIPPNRWGINKAFLNGIVFPLATVIASTFLILITGTGAESSITELKSALPEEQVHFIVPLMAFIISILGIIVAFPQSSAYNKGVFGLLNRELFNKRDHVNKVGSKNNSSLKQVIEEKLNNTDPYHVIAALEMIRVLRLNAFINPVGNLLLKTSQFDIKKYCLSTLVALPQSNHNLTYLIEALQKEQNAQVLALILKNLSKFKSINLDNTIENLLFHPSPTVFVEACLCLYNHPLYRHKKSLERQILTRLQTTPLSSETELYLYALGELHQSSYSKYVLPFLDINNANIRLAAFTAFIRMLEGQLEPYKQLLLRALASTDKEMKIVALRALKECQSLEDWSPVIQLLGSKDRNLVNESKELLRLSLGTCKTDLIKQAFAENILAQQRFEILSLIYSKLSEEQCQRLRHGADEALRKFVQINGLLKLHLSLESVNKTHDLITKVLQEIAEEHLLHVLTVITFASEQNMEFYQRVSRGLLSLSRANQGNALEVLSNAREKYLVNRVLKYFDERLNDIRAVSRIYFALFGETLRLTRNSYRARLLALDNNMVRACLLYTEQEQTGRLLLENANEPVRKLLTENL